MIKWEYKDNRPQGFECWSAKWGKDYEIDVYQIGENRYSIGWYHKGCRVIKDYIDAKGWVEAKALAIGIVSSYFGQMAAYWRDMKIGFTNWVSEE